MTTPGVAFLLAQVGAAASHRFAEALAPLQLTPPQAGLLRLMASRPGASQRELATALGVAPSRVVSYLDDLEKRGLVARSPTADRRVNSVDLTDEGRETMRALATVGREHEAAITAALSPEQRERLREDLASLARHLDLAVGVHPGYRG